MKEILFREKKVHNEQWVYGYYITRTIGAITIYEILRPQGTTAVVLETVGQYTGLKDKNENKVFKDDIVKHLIWGIGVIEWDNSLATYYIQFANSRFSLEKIGNCEIISTIHDNKDLIK